MHHRPSVFKACVFLFAASASLASQVQAADSKLDDVLKRGHLIVGTGRDVYKRQGYDFIDIHGQPAVNAIQGRVIGLTVQELFRIPDVVAIASENTKAAATLGALRSGVINTLATTVTNAHTILALDDATRKS